MSLLDLIYTASITRHPLLNIPSNQSYKFLIIGDSRTSSIQEKILDSITGAKNLVVTNYGCNFDDNFEVLDYFFSRGNKAESIVLSLDHRSGSTSGIAKDWLYYRYKIKADGYLTCRMPMFFYASNNLNFPFREIIQSFFKRIDTLRIDQRDYKIFQVYQPKSSHRQDYTKRPFRYSAIDSLCEKLKSYNISDFRTFTAPYAPDWFSSQSDSETYKKILLKKNYRFYDFSKLYSDTIYFTDDMHLKRKYYTDFTIQFSNTILNTTD